MTLTLGTLSLGVVTGVVIDPADFPFTPLMVPLVLSVLLHSPRRMVRFAVFTAGCLTVALVLQPRIDARFATAFIVMYVLCATVVVVGRRAVLGLGRRRGESMLVDLRDRILAQGVIPALPAQWLVESALSSAGGSPFAGDFVSAALSGRGRRLEVAVVDVSGKGEAAGTRALQLSGAMGGLLSALPASEFLAASNDFLLQREWDEGFASAVHLSLDLGSGEYEVRSAGHPPAVHRSAGSGRWTAVRAEGPLLGLTEDVAYAAASGRLAPGDSLLLYTDGLVERSGRDIELGIDAMCGAAERLSMHSWDGLANRLVAAVGSPDDDRAVVAVHRRPR